MTLRDRAIQHPRRLRPIHRLLFSTLLGASRADLGLFTGLVLDTAALVGWLHPRLLLFALDPEMASAVGLGRRRWNGAVAV